MPGLFITFEGGEGTGKSTQIKRLGERLTAQGRDVIVDPRTRRHAGSRSGARRCWFRAMSARWTAKAEALLNYAAREQHLEQVIRPALARGAIVLCDRFMDSTRAYQGYAGGCDAGLHRCAGEGHRRRDAAGPDADLRSRSGARP